MPEFIHISHTLEEIHQKLDHIKKLNLSKLKPFLSAEEAAVYLGISINTLYQYTSKNKIPFYKKDRLLRFSTEDLDEFILDPRDRYKSQSEIEAEATSKAISNRFQGKGVSK